MVRSIPAPTPSLYATAASRSPSPATPRALHRFTRECAQPRAAVSARQLLCKSFENFDSEKPPCANAPGNTKAWRQQTGIEATPKKQQNHRTPILATANTLQPKSSQALLPYCFKFFRRIFHSTKKESRPRSDHHINPRQSNYRSKKPHQLKKILRIFL